MVPGLCTGGGGGLTHHVWLCASPGVCGNHRYWNWDGRRPCQELFLAGEGKRKTNTTTLLFPQLSATLTIPFWQWFLTHFGKKTAVYIGITVSVPSSVGTWGWFYHMA